MTVSCTSRYQLQVQLIIQHCIETWIYFSNGKKIGRCHLTPESVKLNQSDQKYEILLKPPFRSMAMIYQPPRQRNTWEPSYQRTSHGINTQMRLRRGKANNSLHQREPCQLLSGCKTIGFTVLVRDSDPSLSMLHQYGIHKPQHVSSS